jgi:hypothetical protein
MIIFNQYVAKYLDLSIAAIGIHENAEDVVAGNLSRLRQLYVGLVAIGVASILFKLFCPFPINKHKDEYEFVNSELNIMTSERYDGYRKRLASLQDTARNSLRNSIDRVINSRLVEERQHGSIHMADQRPLVWEGWINENRRSIAHALATIYLVENEGRLIARWATSLLYAIGFLFLGWSSLIIFSKVMRAIIGLQ